MKVKSALIAALVLILISVAACVKTESTLTSAELLDLGEKYLLEMDYEQAIVQFTKLIEVEPMNPRGYTGAAEAYVALGQTDKAIDVLRKGLEQLPSNAEIESALETLQSEKASNSGTSPDLKPSGEDAKSEDSTLPSTNGVRLTEAQTKFFREARIAFDSRDEERIKSFMITANWNAVFDDATVRDEYGNIYDGTGMWAAKRNFEDGELGYHAGIDNDYAYYNADTGVAGVTLYDAVREGVTSYVDLGLQAFSHSNLSYDFDWESDIWGNQGAIGGCRLYFTLVGDYSGVADVLIATWNDEITPEIIAGQSGLVEIWKEQLSFDGRPAFDGQVNGQGFPIGSEDLGKSFEVLLLALDGNGNEVGYVIVPVTLPASAG